MASFYSLPVVIFEQSLKFYGIEIADISFEVSDFLLYFKNSPYLEWIKAIYSVSEIHFPSNGTIFPKPYSV